jgi:glycosyltransferase involved in cell wall biosynthesis
MRIGVDATCWSQRRGYGRHLRGLIHAATAKHPEHRFVMFTDGEQEVEFPFPPSCEVVRIAAHRSTLEAASWDGSRSLADMRRVGQAISSTPLDVLIFPTVYSWVPTWTPAPKLLFIHDVIAERLPRYIFSGLGSRLRWSMKSFLALSQADSIATVSRYSQGQICRQFALPQENVTVVGEAPDAVFRPIERTALPEAAQTRGLRSDARIVVYVGGFNPHKNLKTLLDAFAEIVTGRKNNDVMLALVGDDSPDTFYSEYPRLRQLAARPELQGRVVFTGFLGDEDLARLLNCAAFLVLPSLMEGYGLPAIEAAACGLPSVVTENSPLPELLGRAALAIDPFRRGSLTAAMTRLLRDEAARAAMGAEARAAVAKLTWDHAASELMRAVERLDRMRRR